MEKCWFTLNFAPNQLCNQSRSQLCSQRGHRRRVYNQPGIHPDSETCPKSAVSNIWRLGETSLFEKVKLHFQLKIRFGPKSTKFARRNELQQDIQHKDKQRLREGIFWIVHLAEKPSAKKECACLSGSTSRATHPATPRNDRRALKDDPGADSTTITILEIDSTENHAENLNAF